MSNQRKVRAELNQGLHQFLMTIYKSYRESLSHESAVEQIAEKLKEQYEYFTNKSLEESEEEPLSLKAHIEKLEILMRNEMDPSRQYSIHEDLEVLLEADSILKKY